MNFFNLILGSFLFVLGFWLGYLKINENMRPWKVVGVMGGCINFISGVDRVFKLREALVYGLAS